MITLCLEVVGKGAWESNCPEVDTVAKAFVTQLGRYGDPLVIPALRRQRQGSPCSKLARLAKSASCRLK